MNEQEFSELSDLNVELEKLTEDKNPKVLQELFEFQLEGLRLNDSDSFQHIDDWSIIEDYLDDQLLAEKIRHRNPYALGLENEMVGILFHDEEDLTDMLKPLFVSKGYSLTVSAREAIVNPGRMLGYVITPLEEKPSEMLSQAV